MWGDEGSPLPTVYPSQNFFFFCRGRNQLINDSPAMQSAFSRTLTKKHSSEINEKEKERKYGANKDNIVLFTKDLPKYQRR